MLELHADRTNLSDDRDRVLALLRQFGWNATSFQVLAPGFRYYFDGEDACVAYVRTRGAWVAAGAPIGPTSRLVEVAQHFVAAAQRDGRRAVLAFTEQRFVDSANFAAIRVGEQPVWNPTAWVTTLGRSRSLREQLRRARAKGVCVRRLALAEIAQPELPMRRAIDHLVARWLASRSMAPMGFLVRVSLFEFAAERRIFVAETAAGLCGALVLAPVYARSGFLLENLLRAPDAPNGTTELLVDHAMRDCAAEGCDYLTLGLAPLAGDVDRWLRAARKLGRGLYDFSGLRAFKAKFMPREWAPIFLSHPRTQSSYWTLYDTLVAFAQGGLLRFGIATLLRGPALVLRALSVFLIPWTYLLAVADAERFFPAAWIKWSWVGFDLCLLLALNALTRRFRPALALVLACVIGADAGLTLLEALTFNLPHLRSGAEAAAMTIAVAGPTLASVVLRNVWKRSLS
jgi:phosphatidylglycerol lysyltransferase